MLSCFKKKKIAKGLDRTVLTDSCSPTPVLAVHGINKKSSFLGLKNCFSSRILVLTVWPPSPVQFWKPWPRGPLKNKLISTLTEREFNLKLSGISNGTNWDLSSISFSIPPAISKNWFGPFLHLLVTTHVMLKFGHDGKCPDKDANSFLYQLIHLIIMSLCGTGFGNSTFLISTNNTKHFIWKCYQNLLLTQFASFANSNVPWIIINCAPDVNNRTPLFIHITCGKCYLSHFYSST